MGNRRLKISVAGKAGFCFGVKRAIQTAFETADRNPDGVVTLGPIIHNPQVVEKLRERGVGVIESLDEPGAPRIVIIRSHGISPSVQEEIESRGLDIVDATCPFVKKAQEHARSLADAGYQVVIVGEKNHPEVRGILGYAGTDAVVIGVEDALNSFPIQRKVGIIAQTTQSFSNFERVVIGVLPKVSELKVYNTICNATRERQAEAIRLSEEVDLMLVVGGRNSANTKRLATLCEEKRIRVRQVETAGEIDPAWFEGVESVGVSGGASTPDWIIEEVEARLRRI